MAKKEDRTLSILTHILGLITGFLGPLIIYLVAEDKSTKNHSRLALNWQISLVIYMTVSFILVFFVVGFVFIVAFGIMDLIFSIIAAVRASEGELYKYPLSIPFFSLE